eukprot:GHVL01010839.1.p1 GENE.GHVL01010839.1~~GHVL01010839.1.p1  ORF type:complete len:529 (-),score=67.41 GHVL01010839.1:1684-3270(-)
MSASSADAVGDPDDLLRLEQPVVGPSPETTQVELFSGVVRTIEHHICLMHEGYYSLVLDNCHEDSMNSLLQCRIIIDFEIRNPPTIVVSKLECNCGNVHQFKTEWEKSSTVKKGKLIAKTGRRKTTTFFAPENSRLMLKTTYSSVIYIGSVTGEYSLHWSGERRVLPKDVDFPFNSKPRILSLDGGGVLGLSSLKILQRIEREVQAVAGQDVRLVDYFDVICGTSSGGIITLGLLSGKSITEIIDIYPLMLNSVFDGSRSTFSGFFLGGYDVKKMKSSLMEHLGHVTMNSLGPPYSFVVSTDVKTSPYSPVLLRNYSQQHMSRHEYRGATAFPLWAAAWCTAAAPTYIKGPTSEELETIGITQDSSMQLVDGAIVANNPAFIAMEECARLCNKQLAQFIEEDLDLLVSVGTGTVPIQATCKAGGPASALQIVVNSYQLLTSSTNVHRDIVHWLPDRADTYFRFSVPGLGGLNLDAADQVDLIQQATSEYMADEKHYDIKRLAKLIAQRVPRDVAVRRLKARLRHDDSD